MKSLRIRLIGKKDRNGDDYYFTTTHVPASIDLSNAVIHFYPDEESDDKFGGELVVRHYDPKTSSRTDNTNRRTRRTRRPQHSQTPQQTTQDDPSDVVIEGDEE